MLKNSEEGNIVIIGGGIIGCTAAYFISHHPSFNSKLHKVTLFEASRIAGGASGKAGGLLALWAYPKCIVPLSFQLHKELAEKHDGKERWGYRNTDCGQLEAEGHTLNGREVPKIPEADSVSLKKRDIGAMKLLRAAGVPPNLDWVMPEAVKSYESMAEYASTAQVHPYQFTTSMAALAEEAGVEIIIGSVTSINSSAGAVKSVSYVTGSEKKEQSVPADYIVLSAGPWTQSIYRSVPVSGLRAHSVTIRPTRSLSAYALFTSIMHTSEGETQLVAPEIYARPNNEVYACGEGDTIVSLPKSTDTVQVDESRCQDIIDYVGSISEELRDGEVTVRQACYLPNIRGGGGPLIGEGDLKGLIIATGHTCWGIQNAPGTGKCVAELVWDGSTKSANIKSLSPRRYM